MKKIHISTVCLFLLLIILATACQKQPDYLEEALRFADTNRPELEKVLQHYASDPNDSLKYKAAVFLIENMSGHYSYKNEEWLDAYYHELDTSVGLSYDNETNKNIIEQISAKYQGNKTQETVWDIQVVTSEFLIDNIERAYAVWIGGEWTTHVSFADFCEYILPYKGTELQPLDQWREYAKEMLKADLDTLHYCDLYKNSSFQAATVVSKEIIKLNRQYLPFGGVRSIPVKNIQTIAKIPFGACEDYSILALAVMRSKGIPVMEDFTPQWPFQPQAHSWNILLNNRGKNMVFSAGSSNPGELHNPDTKMAKVFRRTYAINREISAIHASEKFIPFTFQNYFIQDVTDEYMETCDVEMDIPAKFKNKYKYAYLAVFDNKNWIPVHYGKVKGGKVKFEKMGKMCMYLPVFYDEQGIVPFTDPFHISIRGMVKRYQTIPTNSLIATIYRKYFIAGHCYEVGHRMEGGVFEASNRADFSDAVTIYQIPRFTVQSGEVRLDTLEKPYRYWRYYSAEAGYNNLAELYFYSPGKELPIYGKIIGTPGSYTHQKDNEKEVVFDNDPLTFFDAPAPNHTWVGMDFGEPVQIGKISYTPRGDGNDITPGDIHELLYWDGRQWVSMGQKKAIDIKLIYENVPAGTMYWIRNLSRGRDERIFSYENGELAWW
ncbi:hypothetical protein FACS189474_3840 [Bacteroidia bacterium]|nr:hypothetical protein FACS189474_3840 [Bacteroidia bacterium]